MGYAKHVGRVGALAVALGIGAAVATSPGVAWADGETETNVDAPSSSEPPGGQETPTASKPSTNHRDPGEAIRRNIERAADDLRDGIRRAITGVARSSGGAITSTHRNRSNPNNGNVPPVVIEDDEEQIGDPPAPKDEEKSTPFVANDNAANVLRSFTPPRWRAPQAQIGTKPAPKPLAKAIDDVKDAVQHSVNAVTGNQAPAASNPVGRNAFSTLDVTEVEEQPQVRSGFVAPIRIMTNVLNAAIAPFLNPTPGQPAPQNPILWAVLGWARRQVQDSPFGKFVLNRSPQIDPVATQVEDNGDGTFTIRAVATDPDGDDLEYTAASRDGEGTLISVGGGKFLYDPTGTVDWDGDDAVTLTASDAVEYPHVHGLLGFLSPGGGHTATYTVNVAPSGEQDLPEPEVITQPTEREDEPGVYDTVLQYNPETVVNVQAAQGFAPKYWRVVDENYDPVTGQYTATIVPTQAGQLRAALGMDTTDKLKLNVTGQPQNVQTFALRTTGGDEQFAALAEDGPDQALTLPKPPGATLHVEDEDIGTGSDPMGVVVTDKYAYITTSNNPGRIVVIDANPDDDDPNDPTYNTIVKTIDVGADSAFGTLAGNNLYVVSVSENKVYVIDTNSVDDDPNNPTVNTVVDDIDVPTASFSPQVTPDGKRVYVTNGISGDITVIDSDPDSPTYNTVVDTVTGVMPPASQPNNHTIEGYANPAALAFNEDGTRLYVPRIHYVLVYKTNENGDPIQEIESVDYDGDIVVVDTDPTSATYNQVLDLDEATAEVDVISLNNGQSPGSITSNGKRLYVSTYDYEAFMAAYSGQSTEIPASSVLVIDVDPASPTYNQVIDVNPATPETDGLPVGELPFNVAVSPDGSVAYAVNIIDGTVSVIDTATNEQIGDPIVYDSTPQSFADGLVYANILAISPDGQQIYITKYSDGTVTAISIV